MLSYELYKQEGVGIGARTGGVINWNSNSHLKNFTQAEFGYQTNLMATKENLVG